jgi:parallel beta-helix repeat protein
MHRTLLIGLATLFLCGPLHAREIFVAPSGNAGNPGTLEKPLATIADALRAAGAGDVITLGAGTYRETNLKLSRGGEAEHPLILQAQRGAEVIIAGSARVDQWIAVGNGVWRRPAWATNSQQLFCDGKPLKQIAAQSPFTEMDTGDGNNCLPRVGKSQRDLIAGSFYYDNDHGDLFCRLADNGNPNDHLMEASVADDLLDGGQVSHVVVRGITFRHSNGTASGKRSALLRVGGNGWLIEDCVFASGDFAGVAISGEKIVLRRCRVIDNGCVGLDVNGSDAAHNYQRYPDRPSQDLVFDGLTITGNNSRGFYEYWHAGGMKLIPGVRGATIRNCTVTGNHGPGIWFDAALGGNVVENNLVVENSTGINVEISSPGPKDTFGIRIQNNRVVRNQNQGIYISASQGADVSHNSLLENRWDIVLHGMPRGADTLAHNVVRDNLLFGRDADLIVYVGPGASDNVVDGNLYVRAGERVAIGAVKAPGYDARFHTLGVLRKEFPELEKSGLSRTVRWQNSKELDFRIVEPASVRAKGWQGPAE